MSSYWLPINITSCQYSAGANLCMPHTCDIYTVKANDTCYGISQAYDNAFTNSQLISWNIDINRGCDNLELLVDNQISPVPTNVVDGTNTKCGKYYEVRGGDTCAGITNNLGIALSDFYFLNPEINSTSCNNLFLGYSYCVQAIGSINTYPGYGGSPTNPCIGGSSVRESTCYATTYPTASAYTFPVINETASANTSSTSYSSVAVTPMSAYPTQSGKPLATLTPHQDGMVSGSGDGCYDIASRWSIALSDLYAWNAAFKGDCSGLIPDEYICTGRNTTSSSSSSSAPVSTTTATKPTTSSAGTAPPGPTQSGISADCNKWVLQKDGVYCYDMAAAAGISLACLYQMNPALNEPSECAGLWAGEAYCIGTASKVCT
nr:hypothetical protein B0A51_12067 [Rachicladosporium sp. CCFEE 5018]